MKPNIFFSAIEIISGFVTAPSTTETAITLCTGNSLTVRSAPDSAKINVLQMWSKVQTSGIVKLLSPRMHDNVQNIRMNRLAGKCTPLLPQGFKQPVFSQDVLRVLMTGSATAGDIETFSMLIHYDALEGVNARYANWSDIRDKIKNFITVPVTITTVATGDYGGEVAINSTYDLMKANTDYALIGYQTTTICGCIRWRGIDTGNLGIGGPATIVDIWYTVEWFKMLSESLGLPCIPIFNSANKAAIFVDAQQDENAVAVTVYSIFAELG